MSNEILRRLRQMTQGRGKESRGYDELISDERIREILSRFSPILHRGIAESNSFFGRSAGLELVHAVPMTVEELQLWQKYHQVIGKTLQAANRLFVPAVDVEEQGLLESSDYDEASLSASRQIALRGSHGRKYRVNPDEVARVPIQPLDARNLQFLVEPHAYLGGMGGPSSLYNVFIGLHTFVQDEHGRWVVEAIPGTTPGIDCPSWREGPVYSPYKPARSSVWFNTSVDEGKPNNLEVRGQGQFDVTFHCDIHHPETLDQLEIPKDGQLRFFFWQLDAFIRNPSLSYNGGLRQLTDGR